MVHLEISLNHFSPSLSFAYYFEIYSIFFHRIDYSSSLIVLNKFYINFSPNTTQTPRTVRIVAKYSQYPDVPKQCAVNLPDSTTMKRTYNITWPENGQTLPPQYALQEDIIFGLKFEAYQRLNMAACPLWEGPSF